MAYQAIHSSIPLGAPALGPCEDMPHQRQLVANHWERPLGEVVFWEKPLGETIEIGRNH